MFRFETLDIWKSAVSFCTEIFDIADDFPKEMTFSLGSQMRAAALSISNNIAEGSGSDSKQDFKVFLNYAIRSLYETVSALAVSERRGYIATEKYKELYQDSEKLVKQIQKFKGTL